MNSDHNRLNDNLERSRTEAEKRLGYANLAVYGTAHALVDAACAAVVMSHFAAGRADIGYFGLLVALYNVLAFAPQALLGFAADMLRRPVAAAVAGCWLTALSTLLAANPLASVIAAGMGNALFHVGGGVVSLNIDRGKAAAPGIFVAPGALGLAVGTLIGKNGYFTPWAFIVLLLSASAVLIKLRCPEIEYERRERAPCNHFALIVALLSASIAIRALVGFVVSFPWKSDLRLLLALTMAVVLGKALGGVLGDRYGWMTVTMAGLVASAPMLAFGAVNPFIGIAGIFLFNLTMSVTLVAVANMLPGMPGFAFGLTTLALITGVMVTYTPLRGLLSGNMAILAVILTSAAILYLGLRMYFAKSIAAMDKGKELKL